MIDSHCHLTDPKLLEQLEDVLARAGAAGVTRMIAIGTGAEDAAKAVELCRGHENIRCAVGIHPNYVAEAKLEDLERIKEIQESPQVLALGEMGLDYHHNFAPRQRQQDFFERQLQLATDLDRPVVIHCREAVDDTLALLAKFPNVLAVFHCFTGSIDEARRILEEDHLLGFTGAITFKNADELREVVKLTPADRFVVETDAPYLTPEPMRKQKVNEPAMVIHTAAAVAKVKGMSVEEVDRVTTQNVAKFFGWM